MPRFSAALLLAALLLSPIAASAQILPQPAPRGVSVQVAFASVSAADLDALGINFEALPHSKTQGALRYATGTIVPQLYQTLIRMHRKDRQSVYGTGSDGLPLAIAANAAVPDYTSSVSGTGTVTAKLLGYFQLRGNLTLTPHITPDGSVALDISPNSRKDALVHLKAIPSGQSIAIVAPDVQGSDTPILGSVSRQQDSLPKSDELLIFLTPTIDAQVPAQTPAPEQKITMDVQNTDLPNVIATLVRQYGLKAIVQGGKTPFQPVNVHLSGVTPSKALHEIAVSAEAKVTRSNDGIYILTPFDNFPILNYRMITLQHANPADILKAMKWGTDEFDPKTGGVKAINTNLPEGVVRIFALQSNNHLLMEATDEGYTRVKEIAKTLDVAPLRVQLKMTLAAIPSISKVVVDLTHPEQALLQLRQAKGIFDEPLPFTTTDGVPFQFPMEWHLPGVLPRVGQPNNWSMRVPSLQVTPLINSDRTIDLSMESSSGPTPETAHMALLGTTAAFDVTGLQRTNGYRVFLFVTPTVLPPIPDSNSVSVTP